MTVNQAAVTSENHAIPATHSLVPGILIIAALGTIGLLHGLAPESKTHWLYIIQRLYYLPIVLAGLKWGSPGGLIIAAFAGILFMVGTPSIWNVPAVDVLDQCLEVVVFFLVGIVTGTLRGRQQKKETNFAERR